MKHLSRTLSAILAGVLSLSVCLCLVYAKALPKQPGKVYGPSDMPEEAERPSKYDRLLAKYLANIDETNNAIEAARIDSYRAHIAKYQQASTEMIARESVILDRLRTESKARSGGKLNFEGGTYENTVFIPTSDLSGEIFSALLQDGLVDVSCLLSKLNIDAPILSPGWVRIVGNIVASAEPNSSEWRSAVFTLYKAGIERERYRKVLQDWAELGSDPALRALFFDADTNTGQLKVIRTQENMDLCKQLSSPSFPPAIRIVCAEFSARTGNYALAEKICLEVLSIRYKGLDNPDAATPVEDYQLYGARFAASQVLFHVVRSEKAFKTVYDLSQTYLVDFIKNEGKTTSGMPSLGTYSLGRLEINEAQSLIEGVQENEDTD